MSRASEPFAAARAGNRASARGSGAHDTRRRGATQAGEDDTGVESADVDVDSDAARVEAEAAPTVRVAEAARLLARDRTRVYALLRSGDLVAAAADDDGAAAPLRIERSSLERWLVAGGDSGRPLSARNAWALIGVASGDQSFSERCVGLLEHPAELSRARARLARETLTELAPRLRRRAMLVVRQVPRGLRQALERDAALVRTGASAASAYGWAELAQQSATWSLDAYLPLGVFSGLQAQLNRLDTDDDVEAATDERDSVMLRVVDEPWPFRRSTRWRPSHWRRSTCWTIRTGSPGASGARCCLRWRRRSRWCWRAARRKPAL